jgi:hypothetical protein
MHRTTSYHLQAVAVDHVLQCGICSLIDRVSKLPKIDRLEELTASGPIHPMPLGCATCELLARKQASTL